MRETPSPIPNLEAKPHNGEGTAPGRVWENNKPPQFNLETVSGGGFRLVNRPDESPHHSLFHVNPPTKPKTQPPPLISTEPTAGQANP